MAVSARFWNGRYRTTPSWDQGRADPWLVRALDDHGVSGPGRALDVGCGTGHNTLELARRGLQVTAIDVATRALTIARERAIRTGVHVEFLQTDLTRIDAPDGSFDLIVDRGLLMSLFGERARRAYTSTLLRLGADGGSIYQSQWALPRQPRILTPAWWATRARAVVVAPDEVERRFGDAFVVELLHRSVESTTDPGIRRLGIRTIADTSWWLERRP